MKNFESNSPCVCCGSFNKKSICYHHLLTKKAYPEFKYAAWNLVSVCQSHHNEFHQKGTTYMASKYTGVKRFLIQNGWEFDDYLHKWIIEERNRQ